MTLYGLIGKKLGHSFSARYFNERFEKQHIDARYELFEISSIEGISNLITSHPELRGLNVTIPYKQEVLPYLAELTPTASAIGAVNCIRIVRDGENNRLIGHNTDAGGFKDAISPLIGNRRKALLLGLGGASKAVMYALKTLDIEVQGVSRTPRDGVISYSDLTESLMSEFDIIVNSTPLGMWPCIDSCPDIPYEYVNDGYLCFDLVYNPEETEFMKRCSQRGAKVSNGLQMLYNQADLAYKFWNEQ